MKLSSDRKPTHSLPAIHTRLNAVSADCILLAMPLAHMVNIAESIIARFANCNQALTCYYTHCISVQIKRTTSLLRIIINRVPYLS